MKFSTPRDTLLSRLQVVTRAVSTRSAIQALSGVLIKVDSGGVRMEATDVEIGLAVTLEAQTDKDGSVVLPGRLLSDLVRALPAEDVSFELRTSERDVEIVSGASRFHIKALPADEFPHLPQPSEAPISLPSAALVETIERVAQAASRDEARPILTGIHVIADGRDLTMVATDSYRLSVKRTQLENDVAQPIEANIPARALRELSRIVAQDQPETVDISMLENQVVFRAGDAVLSSRLIEGQFPNHRQLLPETFEHEVRLPRPELLDVVRRVSLLAQKNAPLRMAFSDGELVVSAQTPDVGEASEAMPAGFKGEPLEIGFNPDFLREGVESIEGDEMLIKLISPLRPGLIEPVGDDDFRYLVMPIRLNV